MLHSSIKNESVSIILPTFNEEKNIKESVKRIYNVLDGCEIIVSDGNSSDKTKEVTESLACKYSNIRFLNNIEHPELSPSVINAFKHARGDIFCCMDADLQHDEKSLPVFVEKLKNFDMVIGSRFIKRGTISSEWSKTRLFGSLSVRAFTNVALGLKMTDPLSGFFAIKKDAFLGIQNKLQPDGFKLMLEIAY